MATVMLGPLLYAQGKYVRRVTPKLGSPRGIRRGRAGEGNALRLVVLGDSAAEGVGAESWHETLTGQLVDQLAVTRCVQWRLVARTGATTAGILGHLKKRKSERFDVAVTSLGVNDVTAGRGLGSWLRLQSELYGVLRERFDVEHVVVSGLPPVVKFPALPQPLRWYLGSRAREFDAALERLARAEGCTYVGLDFEAEVSEMATDGFHPGPGIYAKWAAAVAAKLSGQGAFVGIER